MTRRWVVYGTGSIARAVASCAIEHGHAVVLAGRRESAVVGLAEKLRIPHRVVDLHEPSGTRRLLEQTTGIINAAGPFRETSAVLFRAALDSGTHYLDVSNEWDSHRMAHSLHDEAIERGIMIVPGAGFGTHAAESLADHLVTQVSAAADLEIVLGTRQGPRTEATRASTRLILKTPPRRRSDGHLTTARDLTAIRSTSLPGIGRVTMVPIADGNLCALTRSQGAANVVVYATVTLVAPIARLMIPLIRRVAASRVRPRGSSSPVVPARTAQLWGYCAGAGGSIHASTLITDDSARYTAEVVAAILALNPRAGTYTPHQILGTRPGQLAAQARILRI
ncbi:saccharopine dehydrogenase NADP-binding domain-containing protein [Microbacterium rhizomatis]|uniref:saccharopine dehydrogenase NADP-binding domain-containing protein n=1 Tax=Microbacterium rhizomatis TaxID=1631477 RepID=UPI001478146C|nr:saccharopine dehydrogenase NADP-binding domain-containing protein [Microbacterium rhizomatis]